MAGEIKLSASLSCRKLNFDLATTTISKTIDQNGLGGGGPGVVLATTAAGGVAVSLGSISTPGMGIIKNLDASNNIQYGVNVSSTFYPVGMLKPGEGHPIRLVPGVTLYLKAITASCAVQLIVLED